VGWEVHVFKPAKVDATPERLAQIKAPPGFKVTLFARGLKNARILAVAPNGDIYVSRRDQGDVVLLEMNAKGEEEGAPVVVAHRSGAHGLAIRDNKLYLATVKQLFVADIKPDGRLGPLNLLIKDLADAGQHADRTIAFGPDGQLYGGFVVYSKDHKASSRGVDAALLKEKGSVNAEVALQMAQGALRRSPARVSMAVTGVLGPGPDEDGNPAGLVYFAACRAGFEPLSVRQAFAAGNPDVVRRRAVEQGLQLLLRMASA
jgi:PncC family amidohydrolase